MSIRARILLGCLSLTLVTMIVGLLARGAQESLGTIALRLYDDAFMSMSYLRSAQNSLLIAVRDVSSDVSRVGREGGQAPEVAEELVARLSAAGDDLEVAQKRAMSREGAAAAGTLRAALASIMAEMQSSGRVPPVEALTTLEREVDAAVEIYAGDGFLARRAAVGVVERASLRMWFAMGMSVLVALGITVLLSRAIVPSVRHAVRVAAEIAAGRLDNQIDVTRGGRRSETALLLHALQTMQSSIREHIARIEALMATQASTHASEIAVQHARFEAALENMMQGLCLFDAMGRVVVRNRRFTEMFGPTEIGSDVVAVMPPAIIAGGRTWEGGQGVQKRVFTCTLADERFIAVSEEPMAGGGWVATYEDITARQRAEAQLKHMTRHDALTGLANRTLLDEELSSALEGVAAVGVVAVLSVGLDGFRSVNDVLGHQVGDMLLQAVSERLRAAAGTTFLARLGAAEFALVQRDGEQPEAARTLADRLIASVSAPFVVAGHPIAIQASVGIGVASSGHADEVLKRAGIALHRAQTTGRGTFCFFEAEMDAVAQARHALESDLRHAVAEGQFEVHYQPVVGSGSRVVNGFEALVRWQHPERGMIPPGVFIPVAEEIGLIGAIGAWVLRRACLDAATWPAGIKVAVNLSPLQFGEVDLLEKIAGALRSADLAPGRLELEITESSLLADDGVTLSALQAIRALGVRVSMDDFGTGYSSLSTLRRFPFDKIKIDQSFVRNLDDGGECLAIVRAVVGLGRSLGMSVVAEGVETEEQLSLLRREGCPEVQGYLFSRPRPLALLSELLSRCPAVAA